MDKKVTTYIEKQASPQKELCQKLRCLIKKVLPDVKEEMKWGVPVFAGGKFYLVALKDKVNFGFSIKGLTAAEKKLFVGGGKTMRHIKIKKEKDIETKNVAKQLRLVYKKSFCAQR